MLHRLNSAKEIKIFEVEPISVVMLTYETISNNIFTWS